MCIAAQPKWLPMAQPTTPGKFQTGFGYITVLFIAMILAIFSGTAYEQLDTVVRRDKEQEWLFVGKQYQQAVKSYYNNSPNGLKELPKSIDNLVNDKRFLNTQHYLRQSYVDPITGGDWILITNEQGGMTGVVSSANLPILQIAQAQVVESNNNQLDSFPSYFYNKIKFEFKHENTPSNEENKEENTNTEKPEPLNAPP